ncbi:MAG: hypothetical protein C4576_21970 [Desulfobacteraceae bacterium]|nr:MAG: hypothetical protein C4576_21970 [Desulfobacteraceae bacterium]
MFPVEDIQHTGKTESRKDDLLERVAELAKISQELAHEAVRQYSTEVEAILKSQCRDSSRIERCLDGMLDFCFDDEMLVLYKRLCRYYLDIDPEATASYVHFYREIWGDESHIGDVPKPRGRQATSNPRSRNRRKTRQGFPGVK